MPAITVVVPVYNVEDYIKKCVDSVLAQSHEDFELLLVDDGSTDESGRICDRLAELDDRIRVIHQENMGLGGARNTGLEAAAGEWLLFLDSDDYLDSSALKTLLEAGEGFGAQIVIYGFRSVNEEGEELGVFIDDIEKRQVFGPDKRDIILGAPSACNKFYKRSLFEKTGIRFPGRVWYEDLRTTPKLLVQAESVVCLDNAMYNYLVRPGSIMNSAAVDRNSEILDAMKDLVSYFKEEGKYEDFKAELEYLAILHVYITASVRVLNADPKHRLLQELSEFMKEYFPNYKSNKYIPRLGRNKRLIMSLLDRKMYGMIRQLFKLKSAL